MAYGQKKLDQIVATDADYCVAPCHNCHSQIHELAEHAPKHYGTVHLWTIICLAAGVLCRNERTYLHDDLKEVNIPEWDETEFLRNITHYNCLNKKGGVYEHRPFY